MPEIGRSHERSYAAQASPPADRERLDDESREVFRRLRVTILGSFALLGIVGALRFWHDDPGLVIVMTSVLVLLIAFVTEPIVRRVQRQHQLMQERGAELEQLSLAARRTSNGVVFTDVARRITWVNDGFTRLTGYSADEALGKSPAALMHCSRTNPSTVAAMREALQAGLPFCGEIVNRSKHGREYWVELDIQPIHDADGALTGFSAIETDITAQVEQRERLTLIFETISEGVVLIGADASIVECNTAAGRILGLSLDQLRGRVALSSAWGCIRRDGSDLPPDELPAAVTLRSGAPVRGFVQGIRAADGTLRWVSVSTQPLRDAPGTVTSVVASFSDVTALLEQEHRMALVVRGAGLGTWDWHVPSGHVIYNARSAEIVGFTAEEFEPTAAMWESLLHPDDRDAVMSQLAAHLDGRTREFRCEHRQRRKDGSWAWVLGAGQVIERATDGTPLRATGINLDLSVNKLLEERAEEARDRYDAAIAGTSDGLFDWTIATGDIWLAPRAWELLGYQPIGPYPRVPRDAFFARVHPEDLAETQQGLNALMQHDTPFNVALRLRLRNGEFHWFRTRCSAQRDRDGRPVRLAGSMRDIQVNKEAEFQLIYARRNAESALREVTALRNALDEHSILSVADRRGRIIDVNTGFSRISGYAHEELIGNDHRMLRSGMHPPEFWPAVWRTIASGRAWRGEICNHRKDGTLYWVDSTIVPYLHEDGSIEKYVAIGFDISAQKVAAELLRVTRAEAEEANRLLLETNRTLEDATVFANDMAAQAAMASHAKSEFLANMSHEIRTPLTAILGYTDVLRDELIGTESEVHGIAAVDTIRRAGEHLLVVINDILDLSKIEAGRLVVEQVEMQLPQLLFDVDSMMQARAMVKRVTLQSSLSTPIPERIQSDPTRLRQILINLVGNAVKFTDVGRIDVRTLVVQAPDGSGSMLRVEVQDTGPGMTRAQARTLFQPFTQADTSVTRRHGGSGLGLTICRRLAGLMGGTVTLEFTMPGRGSRFVLELPLVAAHDVALIQNLDVCTQDRRAGEIAGSPETVLPGGRILLAEDGEDNRRLITYHLARAGADVSVAANGRIALEMILAAQQAGQPFDLLVTDMQMPVMDGYTLARTLRKRNVTIPIIALTAHAMAMDRTKCIDAGCSDYATKPIDRARLIAVCAAWMRTQGAAATPGAAASTATPPHVDARAVVTRDVQSLDHDRATHDTTILLSDLADDPDMAELVQMFLLQLEDRAVAFERLRQPLDRAVLASKAHQLKGAAGGYGYMSISAAAREVERYAVSGGTQCECDAAVETLIALCRAAIRGGQATAGGLTRGAP